MFIADRGLDRFDLSMQAQYELMKRFSAEFSICYFIEGDPERAFAFLRRWAADDNAHVRRLVSEGTRLRLIVNGERMRAGRFEVVSARRTRRDSH